jgi:hypothetical protein
LVLYQEMLKQGGLFLFIVLFFVSCRKNEPQGSVVLHFEHRVHGSALVKDDMRYVNAAGNPYQVDEIQYFVSEIQLLRENGQRITLTVENGIHYVDIDIPSTLSWSPLQSIPAGKYTSVSFIFGITELKNKSGLFVNPPERDMFWPELMGGGYHYMKMNGKWKTPANAVLPFNMHIGVGMGSSGTMTVIQNYFKVSLPTSSFELMENQSKTLTFVMNIEKWFIEPNLWDWNSIGGQIMQNQQAMHWACENGGHVFSMER